MFFQNNTRASVQPIGSRLKIRETISNSSKNGSVAS